MAAKGGQREKIVRATAELLRRRGYAATGLADIIEASRAPKGSLYHYFPGGKDEIAVAALGYAGGVVGRTLSDLAATTSAPEGMLRAYGGLLAGWMAQSGFRDGCPISTTLLENGADNADVAEVARRAFADWFEILADRLRATGVEEARAGRLARLAIMALEGALIIARAERSDAPILLATEEMAALIERERTG